jgi:cellulose synthase/poly-beta-1,6-N-acetylglucosamine synthase-like glycosyltransferase
MLSIIVPAFNEAENITACVDSIKSQNFQGHLFEIIVVDNNSTDNTLDLVRKLDVSYLVETKRGPAAAKNAGLRKARGEIIILIDADCVATENWLTHMIRGFETANIGCVSGGIFPAENNRISKLELFLREKQFLSQAQHMTHHFMPFAATANAAYRKEVFDRIGLFDEDLLIGEDADLSWRMQLFTEFTIKYVEQAAVYHPYESDLKTLFRQKRRHAYGSVMIYKKYREFRRGEIKRVKQVYWEYRNLMVRWLRLLTDSRTKVGYNNLNLKKKANKYQLVLETAWKVGLLQGAIRHLVWYL